MKNIYLLRLTLRLFLNYRKINFQNLLRTIEPSRISLSLSIYLSEIRTLRSVAAGKRRVNSMANRIMAMRYISRRFSSKGSRVLSEEERAAENVYIQRMEREKLERLARQGPKPEETTAASSGGSGSVTDAKLSGKTSSAPGVSTDKLRNYGVLAFTVTALGALGWYTLSEDQETEAVVQK